MKNKRKYLWILTLVSLTWGTATFNSYADTKNKDNSGKKEVTVSKNKGKAKKEKKEEKEVKPARPLKKAKSEEAKFTGDVALEGAHNIGMTYPARTDFYPSLITTNKDKQDEINAFCLDVIVKLGASKKFIFEDEIFNTTLELKAINKDVKLSQIFLTWNEWTVGITKNNFGNIATFPSAKVAQLAWKRDINEMFTVGLGVEEAKEFSFFGKDDDGKGKAKAKGAPKPRKDLPAGSARIQYNLPNELGSIELSGLLRPLGWVSQTEKKNKFQLGYGVNLGGKINIKPETDILIAHLMLGQGIGEYVGDLIDVENQPISVYINDNVTPSVVKGIVTSGVYATYEHHWTSYLRSTLGGGVTAILNDHKKENYPDFYKLGVYGNANLVYWFTEHTSVGLEYGTGYRKNADDSKQDSKGANHLKAIFEFKI